jgi:uncharacterized protein (TIRG00374 family)
LKRNKALKLAAGTLFSLGLLYWCFQKIDFSVFWDTLKGAHFSYLAFAAVFPCLVICTNSLLFKFFLPRFDMVAYPKMFKIVGAFSLAVNVIPFWGGQALFIYLLGQREKAGKTVALSIMTLDQIMDGFGKIFIFGFVVFAGPFPGWMREGMISFFVVISVIYLFLFILSYIYRDRADHWDAPATGFWGRLYGLFRNWAHHLHVLRDFKRTGVTILLAVLMKLFQVLMVFGVQKSLGIPLGLTDAFLVLAALSLGTTLSVTPGRIGLYEASVMLAYQYLGIPATQALALGVTLHVVQLVPYVIIGSLSFLKLGLGRQEKMPLLDPSV